MRLHSRLFAALGLLLALGLALAMSPARTLAQDQAAPVVAIHEGDCQQPTAEPAFEIGEATPRAQMEDAETLIPEDAEEVEEEVEEAAPGEQAEEEEVAQQDQQRPDVLQADGTIDTTFDDLVSPPHAVLVHQSAEAFGTYVACGEITGAEVGGKVVIPLRPVNSQFVGVAVLDEDEEGILGIGEDQVNVTTYLYQETQLQAEQQAAGTPTPLPTQPPAPSPTPTEEQEPTPTPTEAAMELPTEVTIELSDEGFNPQQITIPANTDVEVTLSNLTDQDARFVIEQLGIDEDLPAGETKAITVNAEPGTYEYRSDDQTGTLEVMGG